MKKNIGRIDQILRTGISLGLIYISLIDKAFIRDDFSSYIIAALGIISLIVALVQYCPLYALANINTRSYENE